jgi:hypothetical protein
VGPKVGLNAVARRNNPFTGWTMKVRWFDSRWELGTFIFSTASRPAMGTTGALSQGIKRPGREADHSTHSSAEIKNA